MNPTPPDPLDAALDAAAGREGAPVSPAWAALAIRLRAARQRSAASPPCPPAVLRRVEGIWAPRTGRLALVFDSWRDAAPALRGVAPARTLRFEAEDGSLDLRLVPDASGGTLVQVALETGGSEDTVEVGAPDARRRRRVPLDVAGAGQVQLGGAVNEIVLVWRRGGVEVGRTPVVTVAEGS